MSKAKLSYEAQRSADETAAFFGRAGKGEAPAMSMSGYGAVTSGVGKNRRYDADAEEELDRIAKQLDQAANANPVKAGDQGAGGGAGGDLANKPKGDDPNKKGKPDGIKGDVDEDDGQVGATDIQGSDLPKTMTIPLGTTSFNLPNIGSVSKLLMAQFTKNKEDKKNEGTMKKLYPDIGQPDRFNNL